MTHSITVINPFGGSSHRQSIWERMAVESDLQIRFFVPNIWKDEYGITAKCNTESTRLKVETLQTAFYGNIPLHFFTSLNTLKTAITESDLTYIYHEPFFSFDNTNSKNYAQASKVWISYCPEFI